jgi:hypothetical protein
MYSFRRTSQRRLAATTLTACMLAMAAPGQASATPPPPAHASGVFATARSAVPRPVHAEASASLVLRKHSWPRGEAAGGGTVSWSTRSTRQTHFRQATGWWGAASTKVRIRGASAPHVYAFRMRLPPHVSLSMSSFGEVLAIRHGHRVGMLARPWAKDATGHRLHTWYTLRRHVVKQHVAFGPHTRFPITADPWWNPFTWRWGSAFSVARREVSSCGRGAVNALLEIGGTTVTTNIVLKHIAGRTALMIPGGEYTYAGFAVWGCLGSYF